MDDKFLGRIRILSKIHQEIKQINSWIADFLFYFADCGFLDSKQTNLQHQGIRQTFRLQKIPNTQSTLEYPKYTRVPKVYKSTQSTLEYPTYTREPKVH